MREKNTALVDPYFHIDIEKECEGKRKWEIDVKICTNFL